MRFRNGCVFVLVCTKAMIYYNSSTFSAPEQHATFKNDQEVPIASAVRIKAVDLEIHAPFDDI